GQRTSERRASCHLAVGGHVRQCGLGARRVRIGPHRSRGTAVGDGDPDPGSRGRVSGGVRRQERQMNDSAGAGGARKTWWRVGPRATATIVIAVVFVVGGLAGAAL